MAPYLPGGPETHTLTLDHRAAEVLILGLAYLSVKSPKHFQQCEKAAVQLAMMLEFHALRRRIIQCPHCVPDGEER